MAQSTAFSFRDVSVTVNQRAVIGFDDGDNAVVVTRGADAGTGRVGADGTSIFSRSTDRSAAITLRLQHTSATHRYLHELDRLQDEGNLDGIPIQIIDRRSNEGGSADKCFIQRRPEDSKGKNATVREWVLWTGEFEPTIPNG